MATHYITALDTTASKLTAESNTDTWSIKGDAAVKFKVETDAGVSVLSVNTATAEVITAGVSSLSSATPTVNYYDTDAADGDINAQVLVAATDTGSGTEDVDYSIYQQVAGTLSRTIFLDADQGIWLYPLGETANPVSITTGGDVSIPGSVGIGTTTPLRQLSISKDSANADIGIYCYHDTEASSSRLFFNKADGSEASPTLVDDNAVLGEIVSAGYDGVNFGTIGARIKFIVNGTPTTNRMPTDIEFYTAEGAGDDDIALAMTIANDASITAVGTFTIDSASDALFDIDKGSANDKGDISYSIAGSPKWYAGLKDGSPASLAGDEYYIGQTLGGASGPALSIHTTNNIGIETENLATWTSTVSALQVGGTAGLSSETTQADGTKTWVSANAYHSSSTDTWKYISTNASDEANSIMFSDGAVRFRTAIAGVADAGISWINQLVLQNNSGSLSATFSGDIFCTKDDATIYVTDTKTSSATEGGFIYLQSDDGGAIASGHRIGHVTFGASEDNANTVLPGAQISSFTTELWSTGNNGAEIQFLTTPNTTSGRVLALTLQQDQSALFAGDIIVPQGNKIHFDSGQEWIYSDGTNMLFGNANSAKVGITNSGLNLQFNDSASLRRVSKSFTDPTYSIQDDTNTGMTSGLADTWSVVAGGAEAMRWTETAGKVTTEFKGASSYGSAGSLTIATGVIAITKSYHTLVVEGGAGSGADQVDTATGGAEGDMLILKTTTSGVNDTVTIADGTGADTFILAGGANFVMDHIDDRLVLLHNGTEWVELSRSANS